VAAYFTAWGVTEGLLSVCVCVCVAAGMSPRRLPESPGPSSIQVKQSNEVVPASAGWGGTAFLFCWMKTKIDGLEDRCVFMMWNILSTLLSVYTGKPFWLTLRWTFPCYYIVNIASVQAKFRYTVREISRMTWWIEVKAINWFLLLNGLFEISLVNWWCRRIFSLSNHILWEQE